MIHLLFHLLQESYYSAMIIKLFLLFLLPQGRTCNIQYQSEFQKLLF